MLQTMSSLSSLQVSTTTPFRVGQWVRLWMRKPGNRPSGRRLQAVESATSQPRLAQQQAAAAAAQQQRRAGRKLAQQNPFALPPDAAPAPAAAPAQPELTAFAIPQLYEDPYLQAAVEAAAEAETAYAEAAYARGPEPDEADALSADPAAAAALEEAEASALNPLGLEPIWLASARYGAWAMASEIAAGDFPKVGWEAGVGLDRGGWGCRWALAGVRCSTRARAPASPSGRPLPFLARPPARRWHPVPAGSKLHCSLPLSHACAAHSSRVCRPLSHSCAICCLHLQDVLGEMLAPGAHAHSLCPTLTLSPVPQDVLDEMLAPLNRSSDGSDGRAPSVAVPGSLDFYLCENLSFY